MCDHVNIVVPPLERSTAFELFPSGYASASCARMQIGFVVGEAHEGDEDQEEEHGERRETFKGSYLLRKLVWRALG